MTNPVTKFELQEFSLKFDVGKLMENFFNLRSFSTFGVVHTHHIQFVEVAIPATVANSTSTVTAQTYPQAFPVGVVPYVVGNAFNTGAHPTGVPAIVCSAENVTNAQFDANFFNSWTSNASAGTARFIAIDPTYNVTGA